MNEINRRRRTKERLKMKKCVTPEKLKGSRKDASG